MASKIERRPMSPTIRFIKWTRVNDLMCVWEVYSNNRKIALRFEWRTYLFVRSMSAMANVSPLLNKLCDRLISCKWVLSFNVSQNAPISRRPHWLRFNDLNELPSLRKNSLSVSKSLPIDVHPNWRNWSKQTRFENNYQLNSVFSVDSVSKLTNALFNESWFSKIQKWRFTLNDVFAENIRAAKIDRRQITWRRKCFVQILRTFIIPKAYFNSIDFLLRKKQSKFKTSRILLVQIVKKNRFSQTIQM